MEIINKSLESITNSKEIKIKTLTLENKMETPLDGSLITSPFAVDATMPVVFFSKNGSKPISTFKGASSMLSDYPKNKKIHQRYSILDEERV
jgi:hypothetical protein